MKTFTETMMKLPKGFETKAAEPGTTAHEYLQGRRDPNMLTEDDDLLYIIDDKHPQGVLLYVFNDHSSVTWEPHQIH